MSEHPELAASHRAEIVAERRRMQAVVQSRVGRAIDGQGRVRLDNPDALGGLLGRDGGGTGHTAGAEPPLGTPDGDYYVLVSATDGTRSWAQLVAGPGITIERNPTTGALVISVTANLQVLTFGGDDLLWGGDTLTWGVT